MTNDEYREACAVIRVAVSGGAEFDKAMVAKGHSLRAIECAFQIGQHSERGSADAPLRMRLPCERCGELHVDEGEFATKPHHTHQCEACGLVWRPAEQCTVGVRFLWPQSKEKP